MSREQSSGEVQQNYRERQREYGEMAGEERDCGVEGCDKTVTRANYAKHILDEH